MSKPEAMVQSLPATIPDASAATTEIASRATLPYDVATRLLSNPKHRMTGKQRRLYRAGREIHHVSTRVPKASETKAAAKAKSASWLQLMKWARRAYGARQTLQNLFEKIQNKQGRRWDLLRAQIEQRVVVVETTCDACSAELIRRSTVCEKATEAKQPLACVPFRMTDDEIAAAEKIIKENTVQSS